LLVVVAYPALREALAFLLKSERYAVVTAASLEQALHLVDEQAFALAIADLDPGHYSSSYPDMLAPAQVLRRRLRPTPLGLLLNEKGLPEQAVQHGFVFAWRMDVAVPFDVQAFLTQVAAMLATPLSTAQERQAHVLRRYFDAIEAEDWAQLTALCTADVVYHPPATPAIPSAVTLHGLTAVRGWHERSSTYHRDPTVLHLQCYASPAGLAARYTLIWSTPDEVRQRTAGVSLFRFRGEHICRIGVRANLMSGHIVLVEPARSQHAG
jgi:CheY-like chemotaxis protein